jgi:hypothetical protein
VCTSGTVEFLIHGWGKIGEYSLGAVLPKLALNFSFFVVVAAMLAISGCGNEKDISYKSGGMTQTFTDGKDRVPKDFPLPIYPGATTSGSVAGNSSEEETQFLMLSTADPVEKVSEFYESKLKADGWKIDAVQPEAKVTTIDAHKDKLTANVEIAEDGGKSTVSLSCAKSADNIQDASESAAENYKPDKVTPPTD